MEKANFGTIYRCFVAQGPVSNLFYSHSAVSSISTVLPMLSVAVMFSLSTIRIWRSLLDPSSSSSLVSSWKLILTPFFKFPASACFLRLLFPPALFFLGMGVSALCCRVVVVGEAFVPRPDEEQEEALEDPGWLRITVFRSSSSRLVWVLAVPGNILMWIRLYYGSGCYHWTNKRTI